MIVIIGLIILLVAAIVAIVGVLGNTGMDHALTQNFSVFGYHVTGSTGTLFLFGIVVGAVLLIGLSVLLAGARRTAARGRDTRRELSRAQRETAFLNRDRATLLEGQHSAGYADSTVNSREATMRPDRVGPLDRWRRRRQPAGTAQLDETHGRQTQFDAVSPQSRDAQSRRRRDPQ